MSSAERRVGRRWWRWRSGGGGGQTTRSRLTSVRRRGSASGLRASTTVPYTIYSSRIQ
jgi:hypothetical protein